MQSWIIAPGKIPENMKVYGVLPDFTRMPAEIAATVSPAVYSMSRMPTGGRLRLKTDSTRLELRVKLQNPNTNSGVDVVADGRYCGSIVAENEEKDTFLRGVVSLTDAFGAGDGIMRNITVFFPRTAPLMQMEILLDDYAAVCTPDPYRISKPIVFYGSSITQGASSRYPSRAYVPLVAEKLRADHINLGFGGNALAETAMAEYIAGLEMSAFVMDYEHNAASVEYLAKTHRPFFEIIREKQPELPIVLMSRPDTDREYLRSCRGRQVILNTFHAALDAGDRRVEFIDGFHFRGDTDRLSCTTDGCHPNEKGFARMADVVYPRMRAFLMECGMEC